jgi:uncharacterized LabA/DUF88 family protein
MKNSIYESPRTLILDETPAQSQGRAVYFYVDGFNIWHHLKTIIKNDPTWAHLRFCNLSKLATFFIDTKKEFIDRSHFFTAYPNFVDDEQKYRHRNYIKTLYEYCKMSIHNGKFKKHRDGKPCEEKQTDVKLALQVITDVMLKKCEKIIILSNDTDFVPLLHYIKDINIKYNFKTEIIFLMPPGADPSKDIKNQLLAYYDIDVKTQNYYKIANKYIFSLNRKNFDDSILPNEIPNLFDDKGNQIKNPYI